MMSSAYLGVAHHPGATPYTHDAFLDDLSRQMALSQQSRRLSRGASGHQRAVTSLGNAMRIVKPSSANNSPRSSSACSRRRTMVNETTLAARRRQQMGQAMMPAYTPEAAHNSQTRTSRPVSWHPSSYPHHQPSMSAPYQQQYTRQDFSNQYPLPSAMDNDMSAAFQPHFSPVPAFSCSTSPNSSFSPLSQPYNNFDSTPYLPVEGWALAQQQVPTYVSADASAVGTEPFPAFTADFVPESSAAAWASFATRGFNSTSPPTPENLPQSQQPQLAVSSEDSIPFQALDDSEDDGEILVGMGLYDAPEKTEDDPSLSNSRSAISSLFGSSYRVTEGTGKGLKLEEAWQPPESDDEEDEEDADGDEGEACTSTPQKA